MACEADLRKEMVHLLDVLLHRLRGVEDLGIPLQPVGIEPVLLMLLMLTNNSMPLLGKAINHTSRESKLKAYISHMLHCSPKQK